MSGAFVTGDHVRIVTDLGGSIAAEVILASSNGRSLALAFDGFVRTSRGGWGFRMPVLLGDDAVWRDLAGAEITIERDIPS